MYFEFTVPGKPVPKARPRLGRGGRVFTPQKTVDYENLVANCARAQLPRNWRLDGQYHIDITVWLNSNVFGDLDNMVKSICDGLNHAGVWDDDKYVCSLTAKRVFGDLEPQVDVQVFSEDREVFQKPKRSRKVAE